MANLSASLKDIRKTKTRREYNRFWLTTMKEMVKELRNAKSKEEAKKLLPKLVSRIDRLRKKKVIHKNKAARLNSRLVKYANAMK